MIMSMRMPIVLTSCTRYSVQLVQLVQLVQSVPLAIRMLDRAITAAPHGLAVAVYIWYHVRGQVMLMA